MPWHESIIESELAKTSVLVNATSIGLHGDETPVPGELLPPELLVLDLIYDRRDSCATPRRPATRLADGELMLLHQGAAAFTLWTGQPAPLELMQAKPWRRAAGGVGRPRASRPARAAPATGARRPVARTADVGRAPLPDRRRIPRPRARGHVEGVPAGLALTADALAVDLARRQRGYGRGARQAIEHDRAEIVAGVRHGRTLGSPIFLLVANRDWENWTAVMQVEPLERGRRRRAPGRGRRREQAGDPGHPGPARARRPGRRPEVRLQRRPQRARASVGARDRGARRGRRRGPGVPAPSSASTSGRSRPRSAGSRWIPGERPARAPRRTPRPCAVRIRRPRSG